MNARSLWRGLAVLGLATILVVGPGARPAEAYTTTGCTWGTTTINVDIRYVNGNFRTAINSAITNYYYSTKLYIYARDYSGPSFTSRNASYGATGWEGLTSWVCALGRYYSADAKLNMYYLSGLEPVDRLKVVWLHELGHGLGLGHVGDSTRVMYYSASQAYFNGVRVLTSDEVAGINAIY